MENLEKVYIELSPAMAATHLYTMRRFAGFGLKLPPKALNIPAPGTPTYTWTIFGDPDLTEEEIDELLAKRQEIAARREARARENAQQADQQADDPDSGEA